MDLNDFAKKLLPQKAYQHLLFYRYLYKLLKKEDSYLIKTGYVKSFKDFKPLDSKGQPTPWMNYAFIDFLGPRLNKNMTIFEYGSGYSTLYFSDKVKAIHSIEYDKKWYRKVKEDLKDNKNCQVYFYPKEEEYVKAFQDLSDNDFDIVIVDGRDRKDCIKNIVDHLADHSVLILDDSWKEKFNEIFLMMKNKGYKEISFTGIKAGSIFLEKTTVFYKDTNVLDI